LSLLFWDPGAGVWYGWTCLVLGIKRDLVAGWLLVGLATEISWFATWCVAVYLIMSVMYTRSYDSRKILCTSLMDYLMVITIDYLCDYRPQCFTYTDALRSPPFFRTLRRTRPQGYSPTNAYHTSDLTFPLKEHDMTRREDSFPHKPIRRNPIIDGTPRGTA